MQTILQLLKQAGGWHPGLYLKIENPPYMALVIEATDASGPCGLPAISVCHYGEQNGDLMRDPEMCFELARAAGAHPNPYYWRNDYSGIEQWSRYIADGQYVLRAELHRQHELFAAQWDRNLRQQGFLAALEGERRSPRA
jgi:hypothetical protein